MHVKLKGLQTSARLTPSTVNRPNKAADLFTGVKATKKERSEKSDALEIIGRRRESVRTDSAFRALR